MFSPLSFHIRDFLRKVAVQCCWSPTRYAFDVSRKIESKNCLVEWKLGDLNQFIFRWDVSIQSVSYPPLIILSFIKISSSVIHLLVQWFLRSDAFNMKYTCYNSHRHTSEALHSKFVCIVYDALLLLILLMFDLPEQSFSRTTFEKISGHCAFSGVIESMFSIILILWYFTWFVNTFYFCVSIFIFELN